jgi:hypothetical protein
MPFENKDDAAIDLMVRFVTKVALHEPIGEALMREMCDYLDMLEGRVDALETALRAHDDWEKAVVLDSSLWTEKDTKLTLSGPLLQHLVVLAALRVRAMHGHEYLKAAGLRPEDLQ